MVKLHAIFLSLPLQGHINPSTHLSLKLASKGFTITFLVFEDIHNQLTQAQARPKDSKPDDMFKWARAGPDGLDIRYRVMPDGLPLDFDRKGRLDEYLEWYLSGGLQKQVENEVGKIVLESWPKVNVLITDTLYPWASKVAKKFGLFYASFWTELALVFNLYYHVHLLRENGHFDCPENRMDPIDYIPGVQSINPKDLPSYLQDTNTSTNMHKIFYQAFQDVRSADCVLCNTIHNLEPSTISAIQKSIPFYPIGPIILSRPTRNIVPTSFWAESSCIEWLDSKAHGSVLYVSFGSLANFTKSDLLEIAYGLLLSNIDFVWVLRTRTVLDENDQVLPYGFVQEVHNRGLIIPWTNQVDVLSHRAVFGFLTHCGWNSVLESIWYEMPMLCFPVFTDQFTNRKLVVDDLKIGINLCDEKPIRREKIALEIKSFMSQKVGEELRRNMKDVRKVLKNELDANGSMEEFIDFLLKKLDVVDHKVETS